MSRYFNFASEPKRSVAEYQEIAVSLLDDVPDRNKTRAGHVIAATFVAGAVILPSLVAFVLVMQWARFGTMPPASTVSMLLATFAPFLGVAAIILVAPTHLVAMQLFAPPSPHLARLAYVVPMIIVASLPIVIAGADSKNSSPFFDTESVALIFAGAAPAALIFYLAVSRGSQPPAGWPLALLALVWLAILVAVVVWAPATQRVASSPLATRDYIIVAWRRVGLATMFAAGLAAYVVWHLRMPQIAAAVLTAAICAPFVFVGWYFAVPLGDGYVHFRAGPRTVLIDWRRKPYQYDGGLNFNIDDLEPYRIAGRRAVNKTLRIQPAVGSLDNRPHIRELPNVSREQWGLSCYDVEFRGRPVALCGQPGVAKNWTTRVWIEKGYAFHRFDRDGVRYGLHYDVEDVPSWREIERAAIGALEAADMSPK